MAFFEVEIVEVEGAFLAGGVDGDDAAAVGGGRAAERSGEKVGEVDAGVEVQDEGGVVVLGCFWGGVRRKGRLSCETKRSESLEDFHRSRRCEGKIRSLRREIPLSNLFERS